MKRTISIIIATVMLLSLVACGKSADPWQEQYDLGVRYLSDGNYEEAIIAFTAAIEIDPKREEAYVGLADVYYATGDTAKAEEILAQRPTQDIASTKRYDFEDGGYYICEYDTMGNCRIAYYDINGVLYGSDEYDSSGTLVHEVMYNTDGTMRDMVDFEYATSSLNVIIKITVFLESGDKTSANCIHILQDETNHLSGGGYSYAPNDGTITGFEIIEYDATGNPVRTIGYNGDGTIDYIEEY